MKRELIFCVLLFQQLIKGDMTIRKLTLHNSITHSKEVPYCIPEHFTLLYMRVKLGEILSKIHLDLGYLKRGI